MIIVCEIARDCSGAGSTLSSSLTRSVYSIYSASVHVLPMLILEGWDSYVATDYLNLAVIASLILQRPLLF